MDLEPLLTELRFLANKPAQSLSNLISHFSKDCELPIRRGSGRFFKTLMEPLPATGKYWAQFLCAVADGEDVHLQRHPPRKLEFILTGEQARTAQSDCRRDLQFESVCRQGLPLFHF
jgi:hypothetical protein